MLVSVDLGYGYTKAVSERGRAIFPSVVCPAPESIYEFGRSGRTGYAVEYREMGSAVKRQVLAGELALKSGRAVRYTLARERFDADGTALVLTAVGACLTGAEGRTELAFGLPVAYYRNQKEAVVKTFDGVGLYIRVGEEPERFLAFTRVYVFPQAVGALYSLGRLPESGLVGLIDVGYFTTDFLLIEVFPDGFEPVPGSMSSVEMGVDTAVKLFADSFQRLTGKPLSTSEARALWERDEVTFAGRKLAVAPLRRAACEEAGRSVAEAVQAAWATRADLLDTVLLAGGGAVEFADALRARFRHAELVQDPLFANALGFLRLAERVRAAAVQSR
ncbi:MAG: hypothetical protein ACPLRW_08810 [Moorellales bacterium]